MKTTYITTLTAHFNPFSKAGKVPRLILQMLSPKAHKDIKITQKVFARNSTEPATLALGFKDGKTMAWTWADDLRVGSADTAGEVQKRKEGKVSVADIVEEVNRHARALGRKDELSN